MGESIIEKQMSILRSILSDIAEYDKNGNKDFILYVKEFFHFDTEFGWNILMNAFYVFEDTELAKKNFMQFGLQGGTRYDDLGERYLRLYGILNSVYQQFNAAKNLAELFKIASKKSILNELKNCQSIELRNKIASHPSNYVVNRNSKNFGVYEIARQKLKNDKIILLKNQEIFEEFDLNNDILEFNRLIEQLISEILTKFIKKKFNNQGKYCERQNEIEKLRNGTLIFGNTTLKFKKSPKNGDM